MRLVIVSNRLPVVTEFSEGSWSVRPGSGGLVTALGAVLQRTGGLWIGWSGAGVDDQAAIGALLAQAGGEAGYELRPVPMSQEQVAGFYQGFCNEIIWPLFHDLQSRCNFVPEYWTNYIAVKQAFADVIQRHTRSDDFIWVQDYHLMGLGRRLRVRGLSNRLGFFLHIPFPPPDIFCKLPWRTSVLEGLLYYDIVGFQTPHDLDNFLDCVRTLLPESRRQQRRGRTRCSLGSRAAEVGAFPIGIDFTRFASGAASAEVERRVQELRQDMPDRQIVLGLDRLDYTKGIPDRLRAFQLALRRFPDLHRRITLLQVVVPSREAVPEYQDLKARIERAVAQINGEFTQPNWVPIHYMFRSLDWEALLSYYRAADVALVTPLKDGMNLVAKEYCACQVDSNRVLILSEFAGAAVQLRKDALLVNPYDTERVAAAIERGVSRTPAQRSAGRRCGGCAA